ncbi:hypothetical protein [Enterobacter hormaechei]|uniref:hypothetical protein n=1 Tax=Enterobacter hormaechei TaxID=158836 RepID=UPI003C749E62
MDKQAVQAVADLKAGYTLGRADVEIIQQMALDAVTLLDALESAEKRIAELEAREVVLPQRYSMLHRVDFDEPYHTEMVYKQHQVLKALHDAGICIKVE